MQLVNGTPLLAAFAPGLDPDGRERIVVVIKGTFRIPERGGVAELATTQVPHLYADVFTGEPGLSAVLYEYDFAPSKLQCDVLLVGSAHAPDGKPARRVTVGFRVGPLKKGFEVLGNRYWKIGAMGDLSPSDPEPFTSLPISYDVAFGGTELLPNTQQMVSAYAPNPVGKGHLPKSGSADVFGKKVPNTQEVGKPVTSPRGSYQSMSFGPVGRNFQERMRYAGTYDEPWLEKIFPFLPPDFDPRYYQAAPADQQLPYLRGGETVQLSNLTPKHVPQFSLPTLEMPVEYTAEDAEPVVQEANIDTLILEPDQGQLQLVWRTSFALRRNIREAKELVIGRMPPGFYRARDAGKTFYPSLGQLVAARLAE
jgi:hypothetical protein